MNPLNFICQLLSILLLNPENNCFSFWSDLVLKQNEYLSVLSSYYLSAYFGKTIAFVQAMLRGMSVLFTTWKFQKDLFNTSTCQTRGAASHISANGCKAFPPDG